jgi:hypothetical protein
MATKPETMRADATVTANSRNRRPVSSVRKVSGRKTATAEMVAATTAKEISCMPFLAASSAGVPDSTQRVMFSSTTMASSTTRPIARVTPMSVSVFRVKSRA